MKRNLLKAYAISPYSKVNIFLVVLLFWGMSGLAQNPVDETFILKGKVTSVEGNLINGANILIVSTNISGRTDKSGEFTLQAVRTFGHIQISHIGYKTKFMQFQSPLSEFTILLESNSQELAEVEISTGYQNFDPERFVGSASKLDSANFHRRAGMGVIQRLEGTVTGLFFPRSSNQDNLPVIRGISTFSSNSPLVVVDNFPMDERFDLNTINPNDVQDITVLKDAAAASIWGSSAGNGVIVITTKKGKLNQPFTIQASTAIGIIEKPDFYYYPRMSIDEVIDVERFLFDKGFYRANLDNTTTRPIISPVVELLNQLTNDNAAFINSEIEKLSKQDIRRDLDQYMYRNALKQQYHIAINGGNSLGSYAFSAGYNRDLSSLQNSKASDQFTIRSQNIFKPVKNLTIEAGLALSKNIKRDAGIPSIPQAPYQLLVDENGTPLGNSQYRLSYLETLDNGKLLDWQRRPLDEISFSNNNQTEQFVNLNLATTYQFATWLKGTIRFQHQQSTSHKKDYFSEETYFTRDLINKFSYYEGDGIKYIIPRGGILDVSNDESLSNNLRGQLDFNHSWQSKHSLSGIFVSDISRATTPFRNSNRFYGYDIEKDTYATGLDYLKNYPMIDRIAGTTMRIPQSASVGHGQTSNRVSFLGNASYTYDKRYTIYASARKDGANVFGVHTNNKWKPLWSAGGSWDISKEHLFKSDWISHLKFRSSYGYMGNTTNASGLTTILYQLSAPTFTNLTQASIGSPPNPHLRWEEVRVINAGLDFGIFKGRLSGSIEGFHKRSKDIVSPVPSDPTIGVNSMRVNSASLKGKGLELNLNSQNLKGPVLWNTRFGYSFVKTIVTDLYDGVFRASDFISTSMNAAVDRIAYGLSSYRWAGLDPENGDPRGYLNGEISKDYVGIGNDDIENQIFHGSSRPLHFGFLSNSISYKNITFSANINFSFDYYFRKSTIEYFNLFGSFIGHVDYQKRWLKPGDEAYTTIPSMTYPAVGNRDGFYRNSEVNVLRADHIRLRDLRIHYQLDRQLFKSLPIKSVQLFMYANNFDFILWRANKSDLDPEHSNSSSYNSSPAPQSWTFGLNINL